MAAQRALETMAARGFFTQGAAPGCGDWSVTSRTLDWLDAHYPALRQIWPPVARADFRWCAAGGGRGCEYWLRYDAGQLVEVTVHDAAGARSYPNAAQARADMMRAGTWAALRMPLGESAVDALEARLWSCGPMQSVG